MNAHTLLRQSAMAALLVTLSLPVVAQESTGDPFLDAMMAEQREKQQQADQPSSAPVQQEVSLEELQTRADAGDAQAAYEIASRYYEGKIRPYDPSKTFRYAQIAAETGSNEGRLLLANLLINGSPGVFKRDAKRAKQIFRELYESGYIPAYGPYTDVLMLEYDEDIEKQTQAGKDALRKMHEILDAAIDAERDTSAISCKGDLYMHVDMDFEKAEEYLKPAADSGDRGAKYDLALIYIEQFGRVEEGLNYLRESAGQGCPGALFLLAGFIHEGRHGLQPDDELVHDLMSEAFARGYIWAEKGRVDYLVGSYFGETELTDADMDCLEDLADAGYISAKLFLEQWGRKEQGK